MTFLQLFLRPRPTAYPQGLAPINGTTINQKEKLETLIKELKNPREGIRFHALWTLLEMGPEAKDAAPALAEVALHDNDKDIRYHAARTLRNMGTEAKDAVPILIEALQGGSLFIAREERSDPFVRQNAADALGEIGPFAKEAAHKLAEVLREERHNRDVSIKNVSAKDVRVSAAFALERIGLADTKVLVELINAARFDDDIVSYHAKRALKKITHA